MCGIWTLWRISIAFPRYGFVCFWGAVLTSVWYQHIPESLRQIERSVQLYKPQLELAKKIENKAPDNTILLVDNIPACWINRQEHSKKLYSWFDVPMEVSEPARFAQWIRDNNVWAVLWFQEEWTMAPSKAPFLSEGQPWSYDGVTLYPKAREDGYGWIYYETDISR